MCLEREFAEEHAPNKPKLKKSSIPLEITQKGNQLTFGVLGIECGGWLDNLGKAIAYVWSS